MQHFGCFTKTKEVEFKWTLNDYFANFFHDSNLLQVFAEAKKYYYCSMINYYDKL